MEIPTRRQNEMRHEKRWWGDRKNGKIRGNDIDENKIHVVNRLGTKTKGTRPFQAWRVQAGRNITNFDSLLGFCTAEPNTDI